MIRLLIVSVVSCGAVFYASRTEAQNNGVFDEVETLKLQVGGFYSDGEVQNGVVTLLDSDAGRWTIQAVNRNPSSLKFGTPAKPDVFTIDQTAKSPTFLLSQDGAQTNGGLVVEGRNEGNSLERGKIVVVNGSNTVDHRELLLLGNLGGSFISFFNGNRTAGDALWQVGTNNKNWFGVAHEGRNRLVLKKDRTVLLGNGFNLRPNGNLRIKGVLLEQSDVNSKENFADVESQDVLHKLNQLPISTWNYKDDDDLVRHIGPTAQDFHRVFELGEDDRTIASMDRAGVALAAAKGLSEKVNQLESTNAELKRQLDERDRLIKQLDERLARLESTLTSSE